MWSYKEFRASKYNLKVLATGKNSHIWYALSIKKNSSGQEQKNPAETGLEVNSTQNDLF